MIGSLRRKVFWSILLSAAGVLLAILLAINVLKLVQMASKEESILDSGRMLLDPEIGAGREREELRGGGRNKSELIRSVSQDELGAVLLSEDGAAIVRIGCAEQMEGKTLAAVAAAALADPDGKGRAQGWIYRTVSREEGTGVVLLNAAASLRREITV